MGNEKNHDLKSSPIQFSAKTPSVILDKTDITKVVGSTTKKVLIILYRLSFLEFTIIIFLFSSFGYCLNDVPMLYNFIFFNSIKIIESNVCSFKSTFT